MTRWLAVTATASIGLLVPSCADTKPEPRIAAPQTAVTAAPTVETASPSAARGAASGGFEIHEWGLVGVTVGGDRAHAAAGVLRPLGPVGSTGDDREGMGHFGDPNGLGLSGVGQGYGGKPVLYVHLDEGVERITFSLDIGLGSGAHIVEHWPPATLEDSRLRFADVVATRGACAERLAPPSGESSACASTPDGFCEAAEIPRYAADRDVCLRVGGSSTDLLFYRASGLDVASLPITLGREGRDLVLVRRDHADVTGPVLLVTRDSLGFVTIRDVAGQAAGGPIGGLSGPALDVGQARAALLSAAVRGGLTSLEAEAFVDAWAPAYFDTCRRVGPEAHGRAPDALAQADRSLLYVAPPTLVDALLPLSVEPPARATKRVFLVRVVDGTTSVRAAARAPNPLELGHLGTLSSPPVPSLGSRPSRVASVRPSGAPTVRGGLTADGVRRVVLRNSNQLRYCYEQGLARNPDLTGRLTLAWVISPAGAVASSTVAESTLGDDAVGACAANALRRWMFPQPSPEGVVTVRYTLQLTTASR